MQGGGKSRYPGDFAGAHMSLGLQPEHFQHWLGLWELNNTRQLASREAEEMNSLEQRLAGRLFEVKQGH